MILLGSKLILELLFKAKGEGAIVIALQLPRMLPYSTALPIAEAFLDYQIVLEFKLEDGFLDDNFEEDRWN